MAKASENKATGAYKEQLAKVRDKLQSIKNLLHDHANRQKKAPQNWGFTGDLQHVYGNLVDIENFLTGGN